MEGEERVLEFAQEVLEEASDGVNIVHFAQHRNSFATEELLLQLLHCAISTGQSVQSSLKVVTGCEYDDLQHAYF